MNVKEILHRRPEQSILSVKGCLLDMASRKQACVIQKRHIGLVTDAETATLSWERG
jgi:hypothetical protein